jgi:hypothetical protein
MTPRWPGILNAINIDARNREIPADMALVRWAYWFLPWDNEESVTPESAGVKASQRAA